MLCCFNFVQLFVTLWTITLQAPLCMGFSRQEYWSGLPCPPPGDLPNPGIEPRLLWLLPCIFFTAGLLGKPLSKVVYIKNNTVLQSCPTPCDPMDCSPPRLLCPWDFPGKNTAVGCHFFLQRRSSQARDQTSVSCSSCITGGIFTTAVIFSLGSKWMKQRR